MESNEQPAFLALTVAVVGGGIAGLAAAAALRRAGHRVTVFERSSFLHELGAAIHLQPNAARVLLSLGFDIEHSQAVKAVWSYQADGRTLEQRWSRSLGYVEDEYHCPWYMLHRVDMHQELKRLAFGEGPGSPALLKLGCRVTNVDTAKSVLTLADGTTFAADVIIGADGVHSEIARAVTESQSQAEPTGQAAYRFMIPVSDLLDDPDTAWLVKDKPVTMTIFPTDDRRIALYPCRDYTLMNFVAIHPDNESAEAVEDWNVAAPLEGLLHAYRTFHPSVRSILRKADAMNDLKLWKLLTRKPLQTWTKGHTCIIGDAAHPMLPHSGQGGGQAIEDAGALGVLFRRIRNTADVRDRILAFQDLRYNRASAVQVISNHGQDQAYKVQEEARMYIDGHVPSGQREIHEFVFSYHILNEAEAALLRCEASTAGSVARQQAGCTDLTSEAAKHGGNVSVAVA